MPPDAESPFPGPLAGLEGTPEQFHLPGAIVLIPRVTSFLGAELRRRHPDRPERVRDVELALYEALANAVEHGCLGIGGEQKARALADADGFRALVEDRRTRAPYAHRRVYVTVDYEKDGAVYRIRDEGLGFDPATCDDAEVRAHPNRRRGRGIALIRRYADEVTWNEEGTEIRLVCRVGCDRAGGALSPGESDSGSPDGTATRRGS